MDKIHHQNQLARQKLLNEGKLLSDDQDSKNEDEDIEPMANSQI
jgi:hypothetical protein